jgi:hypothetical protein
MEKNTSSTEKTVERLTEKVTVDLPQMVIKNKEKVLDKFEKF